MKYLVSLFLLLFISCDNDNKVLYETKNAGTHQKAVLALAPAEFTMGDTYFVSILGEKEGINGNDWAKVFIINDWDNALPRDTSLVKITWLTNDTLKIQYSSKLKVYNQVVKTRDNVIVYETITVADSLLKSSR